jgi:DHA1 family inner membrane transport protein
VSASGLSVARSAACHGEPDRVKCYAAATDPTSRTHLLMGNSSQNSVRPSQSEKAVLGVILLGRINLNIPVRLTYFFLPAIGRGLGVSLATASVLVSVRSLTGVAAPLFGALSDRLGGRRVMILGLTLLVLGAALIAGLPWYGTALLGFGIFGLAKSAYDPAMQVYVGQQVPYERRGRALGMVELAWSGSLLGMPLCGWLIERVGWSAPFGLIAFVGILAWWLTRRGLPSRPKREGVGEKGDTRRESLTALLRTIGQLVQDRDARLALAISALLTVAQDNLMVVYGAWMEDRFGLTVTTLGIVTLVFGAAEMVAELGVALLSDRMGKRRAVFISLILTGCGYLLLPRLTQSLALALAGTALVVLAFEFSIVGLIPIISGLNATARGTLMSLNVAATSVGRMVAAPVAVALYRSGDLSRNGPVSAAVCVLLIVLLSRLQERGH